MSDLSDKVVLIITEAGSAIGAATATLFTRLGAKLSLADRNEVNLQRVADECARVGSEQPLMVVADLSCEPDVANLVDTTVKKFGRLDILVNNAGIVELVSDRVHVAGEVRSRDGCQRAGGVPTRDAVRSTSDRDARQHRQRLQRGRDTPAFCILAYCMSKSAENQTTGCTALEQAPKDVRVNSVNPGVIAIPRFTRELGCLIGTSMPFDRGHTTSYSTLTETMRLSCRPLPFLPRDGL